MGFFSLSLITRAVLDEKRNNKGEGSSSWFVEFETAIAPVVENLVRTFLVEVFVRVG
jgi:hypothetical protein